VADGGKAVCGRIDRAAYAGGVVARGDSRRSSTRRARVGVVAGALAFVALLVGAWGVIGAEPTLSGDPLALARVNVPPLAGTLEHAAAFAPDGRPIPLAVDDGRLTPRILLTPGERVRIEVVIRRPGWLSWALGRTRHVQLTLRAPVVGVRTPWLSAVAGMPLRVVFDRPVEALAPAAPSAVLRAELLSATRRSLTFIPAAAAGSTQIAASARSWERPGAPITITWFPRSRSPVLLASPDPAAPLSPTATLRLTFSAPLSEVLGAALPTLSPSTPGVWHALDSHTLAFTPSAPGGFPLASTLAVSLPHAVTIIEPSGATTAASTIDWTVPPGSTLRLQQLLAQQGYLPVLWSPTGTAVALSTGAQVSAALDPPAGTFSWRYPNTPGELTALWTAGAANVITRGAVMMFEADHGLAVDGLAGPEVWRALIAATLAGSHHAGYDYVYVHRRVPQSLTLWSDGHVVLSSPGNTGIPAAPTKLGTFAVYEHVPVGTMRGTNPDGTHYNDPDVRYISYFNGGDALHAFPRASYGTPQSLGCVELPLGAAAQLWPYTPVGTLVTIEN
jgi:peptidoglycan hydrolase-like protein with peptidoglycan-binding domain